MKTLTFLKIFLFTLTFVILFAIISEAYNEYANLLDSGVGEAYRFSIEPIFLLISLMVSLVCSLVAWKFIAGISNPQNKKTIRAVSLSLILVIVYFIFLFIFKAQSEVNYNYSYLQFGLQMSILFAVGFINYHMLIRWQSKFLNNNINSNSKEL